MKVISNGSTYDIYDDNLQTFDAFPPQTYIVRFQEMKGFFLEKYVDMQIHESKIYGVHNEKVQKVLNAFEKFNRNLGVILSGDKGIGKSMFAKILANEAISRGVPLIVVDTYVPGIASYLERIQQEVVVLFDEFDKTFGEVKSKDGEASPQTNLLSLFDGVSGGKKLFVITCNDMNKLNAYLINRPGRFHYHFRFEYPSSEEIREYLQDKLSEEYYCEIDKVISFSKKVSLNYDCLRAIAFEINTGLTFEDSIKDLNIINLSSEKYNLSLHFSNGLTLFARNLYLNMFSDEEECVYLYDSKGDNYLDITFTPTDSVYDITRGVNIIMPENIRMEYDDDKMYKEKVEALKSAEVEYLAIQRQRSKDIHYAV